MKTLRRRLRAVATAWLLVQAASLSAIVPRDCCAAHRADAARVARTCHQAATVKLDGHAHHHAQPPASRDTCALRGACDGPMAGFLAQLSLQGVLGQPPQLSRQLVIENYRAQTPEHLTSRLVPPDSPPPRA
jgi:hypothetical protein